MAAVEAVLAQKCRTNVCAPKNARAAAFVDLLTIRWIDHFRFRSISRYVIEREEALPFAVEGSKKVAAWRFNDGFGVEGMGWKVGGLGG